MAMVMGAGAEALPHSRRNCRLVPAHECLCLCLCLYLCLCLLGAWGCR